MNKSDQINELAKALVAVQSTMDAATKDSKNPFFNSKYAGLPEVWDTCREHLAANGLCVIQTTQVTEKGMALETTLAHTSGQWISGVYLLNPVKNDPQAFGSAMTYARRYALQAIIGMVSEDDDGEAAMGGKDNPERKPEHKITSVTQVKKQSQLQAKGVL